MEYKSKKRIGRKDAVGMEDLMKVCIRSMGLAPGLNCQRVFEAWDEVSGAGQYTVSRFFRNGVLYCTLSSSVVRNRLYFMKEDIIKLINDKLAEDELFIANIKGSGFVKEIVLR